MGSDSDNESKAFCSHPEGGELGRILTLDEFPQDKIRAVATHLTVPKTMIPSWKEIFPVISFHTAILQALLAPADSPEEYYQSLFQAAVETGVRDPVVLLGLLWHAPHGDALQQPQRWEWLLDLVTAGLQEHPPAQSPGASEPLAQLEEKVVIPRYRYEALILQLQQLAARAKELEQQVARWTETFSPEKIPLEDEGSSGEEHDSHPWGFLPDWTDLEKQVSELVDSFLPDAPIPDDRKELLLDSLSALPGGPLQDLSDALKKTAKQVSQEDETEAAIQECLQENPDLAADEQKVKMLHYCLKNYVNFHPDLMCLPLKERVAEACRMAREFLGDPPKNKG